MSNEIAMLYGAERKRDEPKKRTITTNDAFYIPRRTRLNLDFKFGRKGKRAVKMVKKRKFFWE
jgi:hypothetical protein